MTNSKKTTAIKEVENFIKKVEKLRKKPTREIIEKQITILIYKSNEEIFNRLFNGHRFFSLERNETMETSDYENLIISLKSTKSKK